MSGTDKEHGEGNYKASRKYNEATKKFVESGRVDQAARDAEPGSDSDALQMANAEAEGRRRAKEEDPALRRGTSKDDAGSRGKPSPTAAPTRPRRPSRARKGNEHAPGHLQPYTHR